MQRIFHLSLCVLFVCVSVTFGELEITHSFASGVFTDEQISVFNDAFADAARLWEGIILGHEGSDQSIVFPIEILASNDGLASAGPRGIIRQGGFTLPTQGRLWMNPNEIIPAATGFGLAEGNFLDDLLAHEILHALGFGSLWVANGAYEDGTGEYRGEFGLAAYREEFDADAEFIPVELAGSAGSANAHWDQLFRSSPQEGNPDDPLSLSPLIGIVDHRGRDLAQDLMSPAIDPDFGEPFLSNMTVQSMRDIGYRVIDAFPRPGDVDENGVIDPADIDFLSSAIREGSDDSFFDLNSDNVVDFEDHRFWVESLAMTTAGDSNFDKLFNSSDLTAAFQHAEYEDGVALNSTWSEGDWNGDGEFDSGDLVAAFSNGAFEQNAVIAVPEPSTLGLSILCIMGLVFRLQNGRISATYR